MNTIRVAVVGATGYTGSELVRILAYHPNVEIVAITSESAAGERFSDVHKHFQSIVDTVLVKAAEVPALNPDVVFLGLPHRTSMNYVKENYGKGFKIIDLSGDFRLSTAEVYHEWYETEHVFPEGIQNAVYGMPELHRERITGANLIANPGCYPTSAILGLTPLMANDLVDPQSIVIDSKSGITGAGIKPKKTTHYSTVSDNFKAYGLKSHRHTIEIQEQLAQQLNGDVRLQFTPHLLPVDRGILSTSYLRPKGEIKREDLTNAYNEFYKDEPFIRITDAPPSIKDVRGSNYCNIYVDYDERTKNIIVISVIDNLVKGAAGLAVQNMNIMLGIDEPTGLEFVPINP